MFLAFLSTVAFQCTAWALAGNTPGRLLAGVVLVHAQGRPISKARLILRNFVGAVSLGLFGMGYLLPIIEPSGRTLHDVVTSTVLVERKVQP